MGAFVAIKRARSIQERSGVRLGLPSILEGHSAAGPGALYIRSCS